MPKRPMPARIERILILALVILGISARIVPGPRIIDDAFITFRYARNIVRGDGFVYNPGEHVLGTTTPLYTLLLSLAGWASGSTNYPDIAPVINALADGVAVVLLYVITRRLTGDLLPAFVAALLWAISPRSAAFAISGMETSIYVMLMLGAFAAWVTSPPPSPPAPLPRGEGRVIRSVSGPAVRGFERGSRNSIVIAVLTGLAILTRPDALTWAGPLALAMIWERWKTSPCGENARQSMVQIARRLPWRELVICLGVMAPWLVYGTIVFGSPLTRSFTAKLMAYPVPWYQALATFAVHYGIPFFEQTSLGTPAAIIGLPLYTALGIGGAVALIRADWRAAPLALFPWLYVAGFAAANPPMFHWYLVPPMPMYIMCITAGVWALVKRVTAEKNLTPRPPLRILRRGGADARVAGEGSRDSFAPLVRNGLMLAVGGVWVAFSLNAWTLHPGFAQDRPAPLISWNLPELYQVEVGTRLGPLARPGKVIAAADIGALGWASDARILDVIGLISPQATPYYPVDPAMIGAAGFGVSPDLIFDQKPDYIMLHEAYGQNGLFKDPRFAGQYHLLAEYPIDVGHSKRLLVFERDGAP